MGDGHTCVACQNFRNRPVGNSRRTVGPDERNPTEMDSRAMRTDLEELYDELARAPEDWSIRLRILEVVAAAGEIEEARRLVRHSPDGDRHLPGELQERIHALLLKAMSGRSSGCVMNQGIPGMDGVEKSAER